MDNTNRTVFYRTACGVVLSAALLTPTMEGSLVQQATGQRTPPNQNQNPPAQTPPSNQPPPAPLFQGKTNLKSSRQTKDTASAGFNGIGPSGEIDKKLLADDATAADDAKAYQLGNFSVSTADLNAFIAAGNLKAKP